MPNGIPPDPQTQYQQIVEGFKKGKRLVWNEKTGFVSLNRIDAKGLGNEKEFVTKLPDLEAKIKFFVEENKLGLNQIEQIEQAIATRKQNLADRVVLFRGQTRDKAVHDLTSIQTTLQETVRKSTEQGEKKIKKRETSSKSLSTIDYENEKKLGDKSLEILSKNLQVIEALKDKNDLLSLKVKDRLLVKNNNPSKKIDPEVIETIQQSLRLLGGNILTMLKVKNETDFSVIEHDIGQFKSIKKFLSQFIPKEMKDVQIKTGVLIQVGNVALERAKLSTEELKKVFLDSKETASSNPLRETYIAVYLFALPDLLEEKQTQATLLLSNFQFKLNALKQENVELGFEP